MSDSEYKASLEEQKRELQITLIREKHPVYADFDFNRYSDQKVNEMYRLLVLDGNNNRETETQTKV